MATIPLSFEFFRCRVDVLQSYFLRSTISIAAFCLQNLIRLLFIFADQVFIDPMFFGIFVFGPLQSSVVNVCTIQINIRGVRVFDFGPQQFSTVYECLNV